MKGDAHEKKSGGRNRVDSLRVAGAGGKPVYGIPGAGEAHLESPTAMPGWEPYTADELKAIERVGVNPRVIPDHRLFESLQTALPAGQRIDMISFDKVNGQLMLYVLVDANGKPNRIPCRIRTWSIQCW